MISLISIYVGGILTIGMAFFHTQFFKIFKWEGEYTKISTINRKVFHTIHLALLLMFFLLGVLTIFSASELSQSKGLAFGFNLIISLLWLWRMLWQIVYFKGKTMHYVLIIYFSLLFITYLIPIVLL